MGGSEVKINNEMININEWTYIHATNKNTVKCTFVTGRSGQTVLFVLLEMSIPKWCAISPKLISYTFVLISKL